MQMKHLKKSLSYLFCIVLIAAMALCTIGCNAKNQTSQPQSLGAIKGDSQEDATVLGEGDTSFTFTVIGTDGNEVAFLINTDKETVGEALLELELIDGENGDYGLYVKTVNGITLDFDKDGKYWAFYANGEYAMSGVDTTEIKDGATYSFKAE